MITDLIKEIHPEEALDLIPFLRSGIKLEPIAKIRFRLIPASNARNVYYSECLCPEVLFYPFQELLGS
tara:strand:- start:2392 stop:2595 length:204 start_codon:yes stop_codon:yes gene_type:complete